MKNGTELLELEVDRVDVVDKPATKRVFLLMKSEDGDKKDDVKKQATIHQEPVGDKPPVYESMAKSVLDVFADAPLTKAQAESLDALAKAMGSGHKYKVKEVPYTDEEGKKKPGDAQSDMPGMMKAIESQGAQVESLAKSVKELGSNVEKLAGVVEKSVVQKAEDKGKPPASTQGKDGDDKKPVVKKAGEGLFASIIFPEK